MDLNATLNRIKKISGVMGYVIINDKAQVVHTTLDEEEATSLGAITIKMIADGNDVIHEFGDDTAEYICIRSRSRDIMVVPGKIYSFAVLRNPNVTVN